MPIYEYICDNCNSEEEVFRPMAQSDKATFCSICKKKMRKKIGTFHSNDIKHERYSAAMGVNISQIDEAKKAYPGSEYNERGDLLIKSRKHKKFEMKRRGMIEFD